MCVCVCVCVCGEVVPVAVSYVQVHRPIYPDEQLQSFQQ